VEAWLTVVLFNLIFCVAIFALRLGNSLLGWLAFGVAIFGVRSPKPWQRIAFGVFGVLFVIALVLHFS